MENEKKYHERYCVWSETEKKKFFPSLEIAKENMKENNRLFYCYDVESRYTADGFTRKSKEIFI